MSQRFWPIMTPVLFLAALIAIGCAAAQPSANTTPLEEANNAPAPTVAAEEAQAAGESVSEPLTIEFWHGLTGPDGAFLQKMVDKYNAENQDGLKVNLTTYHWDVFFDKWVASSAAGNPPDAVIYHISEMPQYVEKGIVAPIDELAAQVGLDMNNFPQAARDLSYYQGKLYSVPLDVHPIAMYYNVDMVKAAGLDPNKPPQTRDEFLEWAQKLTRPEENIYGTSMPSTNVLLFRVWWGWLFQNGGQFLNDKQTECVVNNPAAEEALQFAHDLVYKYKVAPEGQSDPDKDFASQRVAITFQGPWWIQGFVETEGLNFMTAPQPQMFEEKKAVWASSHIFGLSEQADQAQKLAAMKFVKWMEDNAALWGESGQIPANQAARESETFKNLPINPYQQAFIDELEDIVIQPAVLQSTEIFAENVQTPLVINWQAAMAGAKDMPAALDDMAAGITQVLQRK